MSSDMAIVYRIERSHRGVMKGIYQSLHTALYEHMDALEFSRLFCQQTDHPHPLQDGMTRKVFYDEYIFGFLDVTMMCEWFGPEQREYLSMVDAIICLYELDTSDPEALVIGGRQIAFDPRKASLAAEFPMAPDMSEQDLLLAAEGALRLSR